jgi:preprotein translocase SecE subunit
LPTALILRDRYVLRNTNKEVEQYVRVKLILEEDIHKELKSLLGTEEDQTGKLVRASDLEEAVRLAKQKRKELIEPLKDPLWGASGTTEFRSLTLLPAVPYTLPLLLVLLSAWLAWRAVNLPAFADFLIATEAELNKVSWTTQKRLVQDTIVVLVTVVLMAVYLFGVDQLWRVSLSWDVVRVLVIPKDTSGTNRSVENKNW